MNRYFISQYIRNTLQSATVRHQQVHGFTKQIVRARELLCRDVLHAGLSNCRALHFFYPGCHATPQWTGTLQTHSCRPGIENATHNAKAWVPCSAHHVHCMPNAWSTLDNQSHTHIHTPRTVLFRGKNHLPMIWQHDCNQESIWCTALTTIDSGFTCGQER